MLRIWTSVLIACILSRPGLCSAQVVPSQNSAGIPNQAASSSAQSAQSSSPSAPAAAAEEDDEDNPDIPAIARGHIGDGEYLRLRDQHLGRLRGLDDLARNPQARSQAIRKMEDQEKNLQRQRAASTQASGQGPSNLLPPTWTPLGPDPIPNGQVQVSPGSPVPVSGRVTAIAVDPTNENIVYVGTAQGGLYRSIDGGSTWLALMDQQLLSLAIGALTIDPTDPTILFVGTGEGNFSIDSFFGVGLYIITGANSVTPVLNGPFHAPTVSPNPDGFTDVFTGRSITRILVNPADHRQILVSTASGLSGASGDVLPTRPIRGVYASSTVFSAPGVVGTPTFTRLTIQTPANENVTDMVMDPNPANSNLVVVSVIGTTGADGGVWVSNNAWAAVPTWTRTLVKTGRTFTINGGPATPVTKFAVSRGGAPATTTFFAVFDEVPPNCASSKTGTMSSSPDGVTWTNIPAAGGFCGGQCWYDMAVAVHPTDATKLYIGGNAGTTGIGSCSSGAMGISTNGGGAFVRSDTSLHADSHATAVSINNPMVVYTGNDGGIFRSIDGGSNWNSLNNAGFTATQFESLAVHPTDTKFTIGGTQDNGTEFLKPDGTWTRSDGGDGGFSAIDQNATDTTNVTMYHTYFNQKNNLVGYAPITTSATVPPIEANWGFVGCASNVSANGITCADTVLFYAPLTVGPGSPNTVYYGTDHVYRSADKGNTNTGVSQVFASGVALSAIGISPVDDNVRLVGLERGQVFATTMGANPMTDVTGPWTSPTNPVYVARAVIDPNNKTTAYVTLDGYGTPNHIWKTTNLVGEPPNPTWVAASTGLPDVPVNAFAVDPTSPSLLYAGTDIGVFNSTDGGATWNPYGTGLPRVAVFDLKVTAAHVVRIATHGRGMWEIPGVTPTLPTTTTLATSTNNTTFGTPVTLTATVNTNGNPAVPTGAMTFLDGGNVLGNPVTLTSGQATLVTSALSVASHSITAHYSGNNVYSPSTSAAQMINVSNAPNADYSLNIPTGSATIRAGSSATFTINLTPSNGFTGSVNFSCTSGVPQLASCQFTPAAVALNGSAQGSTTLTITTTAPTAAPPSNLGARLAAGGGLFALAFVFGFAASKSSRRTLFTMLGVVALTAGLISCGGGGGGTTHNPGTPPGTYTVAFTATSGSISHQSTITLNVQ